MGNVQYDGWPGVSAVPECSVSKETGLSRAQRQFISVTTDLGTWRRCHYMLVVLLHLHDVTHHFVKLACSSRVYGSN